MLDSAAAIALRVPSTLAASNSGQPPSDDTSAAAWKMASHPSAAAASRARSMMSPPMSVAPSGSSHAAPRGRPHERAHMPAVGRESFYEIGAHLAGGAGDQRAPH